MKIKSLLLALVAAFALVSLTSSVEAKQFKKAKAVPSGTVDTDGDGYFSDDKDASLVDCDDKNPSVNPGAKEVWDNGIDDDCKDGDAETPPLAVLKAFGCNPNNKVAVTALKKEWSNCEKDSAHCTVDKTKGGFFTAEGYEFRVKKCGGLREVVDAAEVERLNELESRGAFCSKKSTTVSTTTTDCSKRKVRAHKAKGLPGDATPTTTDKEPKSRKGKGKKSTSSSAASATVIVEVKAELTKTQVGVDEAKKTATEASKKADQASKDAEAAAKLAADLDDAMTTAESHLERHDGLLDGHKKLIDMNAKAIEEEGDARRAEDKKIHHRIDKLDTKVESLAKPVAELYLGAGTFVQNPTVFRGTSPGVARGYVSPFGQIGANLGVETDLGRLNAFGLLALTGEQTVKGSGTGLAYSAGVDGLFRTAGSAFVGGHVLYQYHESNGDILGAEAIARGVGVGLTYKSGWLLGRVTVGYESVGNRGNSASVESGPFAVLSVGGTIGL